MKRRRYVWYDNDDDDNDNETSAPATTDTVVSCEYHDDLTNEYSCPRPTKRQRRRCITLLPSSFTKRSRLFVPMLEDPEQGETSTTTCTHQEEGGFPPPSLPFAVSYRQEVEEDERREGAGRSVSPWNYHFDETTPKKKRISRIQNIEQEEEMQPYDIEQGQEQQQGSRGCSMHPFVYHNNSKSNSNPSPLPWRKINKSTRSSSSSSSSSSNYLLSYPHDGSPEGTVQRQRQRQTSRRVLPSPSSFLPSSSPPFPFPVVDDDHDSTTTTTTTDVLIEDTIVEYFQRATRFTTEEHHAELPLSTTTTIAQTAPLFDRLRY